MKTIAQQVQAMRRHWPSFEVAGQTVDQAVWFGSLAGIERSYRVMVEYRLTQESRDHGRYNRPLRCRCFRRLYAYSSTRGKRLLCRTSTSMKAAGR